MSISSCLLTVTSAVWRVGSGPLCTAIVLGRGDDAVIMRIVALHAGDKGHAHARGQERIFAVGLLAAAPAGIAKDVDVRRPEIQALQRCRCAGAHGLHMLDAPFGADGDGHLVNGGGIEGGAEADRAREIPWFQLTATPCSASLHQS